MNDPIDIQDGACEPKKKSDGGPAFPLPSGHERIKKHAPGLGDYFATVEVCKSGPSVRTLAAMHFMVEMIAFSMARIAGSHSTLQDPQRVAAIAFDAAQAFVDEMEKRDGAGD